ncbi:hypothetical protein [Paraburkholderia sp. J63]|uniref:hypothetical protein n=1 Tax=Paraburkholderia sp. J63 TaxID=2805434 RepID=UPI002ABE64EF|nr:hypothetical protein [Paraburkholderia sp. J63]
MPMIIARPFFVPLCVAVLVTGAHAQTSGGAVPPDAPARQYRAPLQQNLNSVMAAPAADPQSFQKRCKEIAAAYGETFRPPGPDQANAVVPNYGNSGEQANTMQAYGQRRDAEKSYHDAGCH